MVELTFYDVKARRKFTTDSFRTVVKGSRRFAVATTPSGGESYRIMGKA